MRPKDILFGNHKLRVQPTPDGYVGIVVGKSSERYFDSNREGLVAKLQRAASASSVNFVGYDGAIARFTDLFPDGFEDSNYIGDANFGEQHYKRSMAHKLQSEFPLDTWHTLNEPLESALRMFRATNLIDPFTKSALQNVLRSSKGYAFLEICTAFANGEVEAACKALVADFKKMRPSPNGPRSRICHSSGNQIITSF